jgi:protein-S-isoprenylcysteine O-methyltransferase Ste14
MRTAKAAIGSVAFFLLAPGVVAGAIPWWLTGWEARPDWPAPVAVAGWVLATAGVVVLVRAFVRFAEEGLGTPAPVAPTERLVVGGPYRYVRNPMYLAVLATIAGQAVALGRWILVAYAVVVWVAFASFVGLYEEPHLTRRFGARYEAYRAAVPGWVPLLRPWRQPNDADS